LKILEVPPLPVRLFGDIVVFVCVRLPSKRQQSHSHRHTILPVWVPASMPASMHRVDAGTQLLIAVEAHR
jgi:hypothetical protein